MPHRMDKSETTKNISALVAGGLAGMTAKTVVAPLERVKIIYQVTNAHFSLLKFPHVLHDILIKEGVFALWRGHSASLLRVVPYAGIQFMTYDYAKRQFASRVHGRDHEPLKLTEVMMCGGTAGAVSTGATYPLDLARSRIAVTPSNVQTRFHVIRSLHAWHRLGGVKELYRGFLPTVLGVVPYGAIAFSSNEGVRRLMAEYPSMHRRSDDKKELKSWVKLFSGGVAGIVAQTSTYPLEITRRRMQTHGHIAKDASVESTYRSTHHVAGDHFAQKFNHHPRMSMASTFVHLYTSYGWRVFYKGVSLNWIKGPITVSISFTTFDIFRKFLEKQQL